MLGRQEATEMKSLEQPNKLTGNIVVTLDCSMEQSIAVHNQDFSWVRTAASNATFLLDNQAQGTPA